MQSDGKILVGGIYGTIGGQTRSLFARLSNDTVALSTLAVKQTTLTLTRDGSAPQFSRVIFEQSINNSANRTPLGTATNSFISIVGNTEGDKAQNSFGPTAAGYTLTGQNIPTGQNVLIRARGFYRTGFQNGSETIEDKVQIAYLLAPTAANVSVSGRVIVGKSGLTNAVGTLTDSNGETRTARTTSFGYYRFDDLAAGQTIVLTVTSKRYQFAPQVVNVQENLTDLDFYASSEESFGK